MKNAFVTGGSGFVGQNLIPNLINLGYSVYALARSADAIKKIESLGAKAIKGDLENLEVIETGLKDIQTIFHLAASVDFYASKKDLEELHVVATDKLIAMAKQNGITNFIYLSAASVIMNGQPINNANEHFLSDNLTDGYSQTKLAAEKIVLAANAANFRTIAVRPPLIWGKGDPNVLPKIIEAVNKGQMQFIAGGKHKISVCNVANVCEALQLAVHNGKGGQAYFITDGESVVFKDFIKSYVATENVEVPDKEVSIKMAKFIASAMEFTWKTLRLKGHPPLYKAMINTLGLPFIINDDKARRELGYKPVTTIKEGLAIMMV
jgi:nucleoside-diphosphate-sugar epimerase